MEGQIKLNLSNTNPTDVDVIRVRGITAQNKRIPSPSAKQSAESKDLPRNVLNDIVKANLNAIRVEPPLSSEELGKVAERVEELFFSFTNRQLSFEIDENTGRTIIKIIDRESGEIVRQIPPQEFLDTVAALNKIAGSIFKENPRFV